LLSLEVEVEVVVMVVAVELVVYYKQLDTQSQLDHL
jgi:hypothetical protein